MAFNIGLEIIGVVRGATADTLHSAGSLSSKLARTVEKILDRRMIKLADTAQESIQEIVPIDFGYLERQVEIDDVKDAYIVGISDSIHESPASLTAIPGSELGTILDIGRGRRGRKLKRSRDSKGGQKQGGDPTADWIAEAQKYFIGKLQNGL